MALQLHPSLPPAAFWNRTPSVHWFSYRGSINCLPLLLSKAALAAHQSVSWIHLFLGSILPDEHQWGRRKTIIRWKFGSVCLHCYQVPLWGGTASLITSRMAENSADSRFSNHSSSCVLCKHLRWKKLLYPAERDATAPYCYAMN